MLWVIVETDIIVNPEIDVPQDSSFIGLEFTDTQIKEC